MKLYLKGKMFDALDTVAVTDENDEPRYYLERDKTSAGHIIALTDTAGVRIAEIEQRGGIVSKASFAVLKVTKDGETVTELKVALLKSEIDIADEADLAAVVAVVLAIRLMLYHASIIGATAAAVGTGAVMANITHS